LQSGGRVVAPALDEHGRNDPAAALQWHRALLERHPAWLPSLRRLEQQLITEGRDEELEPVRAALVEAGVEVAAQAQTAARLRLRHSAWDTTRDLVARAAALDPPGVWALRQQQAHARLADDAAASQRVSLALVARTAHPGERTTLLLRAAEAAERLGDPAGAIAQLRQALELSPTHLLALLRLAELLDRAGDPAAARYLDEAARAHQQPAHQAPLWYRAAVLWLAQGDRDRATAAFESVAAIDVNHADVFEQLRTLLAERGDGARLASLLQRRLETEESPERRVELEVALGRALTELGDRAAAKTALAAALDSSPDHVDALRAFVDLCVAEEDWDGAEQALVRLGRLVTDPVEQADLYTRLGDLYRLHLPNFERAELSYLEVLKRVPDSVPARERLVKLHLAQGNKDKAFELQQALLASTTTPADKRQRTIELAELHEQTGDLKKAEQTLEALRKEFPQETSVLRSLAAFHLRHQHGPAANVLLDRAAADARRALATGRFELHFFANLAAVFELREQHVGGRPVLVAQVE
ncbi:MAG: tetratricopeptide repeat protein, partial [Myxococcales bacterium]